MATGLALILSLCGQAVRLQPAAAEDGGPVQSPAAAHGSSRGVFPPRICRPRSSSAGRDAGSMLCRKLLGSSPSISAAAGELCAFEDRDFVACGCVIGGADVSDHTTWERGTLRECPVTCPKCKELLRAAAG